MERRPDPGPPWTRRGRTLALRQRRSIVDLVLRVLEGFQRHRTGRNAALIAHFGFLSVFPLMVVLTTILGFVLQNRTDLRNDIIDSALGNLPFVDEIPDQVHIHPLVLVHQHIPKACNAPPR